MGHKSKQYKSFPNKSGQNSRGKGPRPNESWRELVNKRMEEALNLQEDGDIEGALDIVDELTTAYPREAKVQMLAGILYNLSEDHITALEHLTAGVKAEPNMPSLLFNLAQTYAFLNMPFHAQMTLKRYSDDQLREDDDDTDDLVEEAEELRDTIQETTRELAKSVEMPLAKFEKYAVQIELGQLALLQEDSVAAEKNFAAVASVLPKYLPAQHMYLITLTVNNKITQIRQIAKHILTQIDPHDPLTLKTMIRLEALEDNRGEAEKYIAKLPEYALADPEKVSLNTEVAEAYAWLDHDQEVYDLLQKVSVDTPTEMGFEHKIYLAVAAARLNKKSEALKMFEDLELENEAYDGRTVFLATMLKENIPPPPSEKGLPYFEIFIYTNPLTLREYLKIAALLPEQPEKFKSRVEKLASNDKGLVRFLVNYLWMLTEAGELPVHIYALALLKTPLAREGLKYFAFSKFGHEDLHLMAASALTLSGDLKPGDYVEIWTEKGQITEQVEDWATFFPRALENINVDYASLEENDDDFDFVPEDEE